jgi:hypothetical protein
MWINRCISSNPHFKQLRKIMEKTELKMKIFELDKEKLDVANLQGKHSRITNVLDENSCRETVKKLGKKLNCDETTTIILIAGLAQNGGTNKASGNSIKYNYLTSSLTAQELQTIATSVKSRAKNRQLARALSSEIAEIALHIEIESDLANQVRYEHLDLSLTEAVDA